MSAARTRSLPLGWLGGLGCGALLMLDPASLLFAAVLMSPTILMRAADDRPERSGTRAVLLCNLAAVVEPACRLWRNGPPTIGTTLDELARLDVVAAAWLAAGSGWLLSEMLIFSAQRWLEIKSARAVAHLDVEIEQLVGEWGDV